MSSLYSGILRLNSSKSKSKSQTGVPTGSSSSKCRRSMYGCERAYSIVILAAGSKVSIFLMRSIACSLAPLNNSLKSFPRLFGSYLIKVRLSLSSIWSISEASGLPIKLVIIIICSCSVWAGKSGLRLISSARMQPTLQTSIEAVY